jgi:hypothetical protein
MKLPRWLLIGLLTSSVLAVLAASGWWWVTWPERTARGMLDSLAEGRLEDAKMMIVEDPSEPMDWPPRGYDEVDWRLSKLEPLSRSLVDMVQGRQRFGFRIGYQVEVERGYVVPPGLFFTGRLDGFGRIQVAVPNMEGSDLDKKASDSTP